MKNVVGLIIRIVLAMLVVWLTSVLTPGMSVQGGFGTLAIAALAIAIIQHLLATLTGLERSGLAKGISGFLVTALILFLAGKVVSGFNVSIIGALIGGLVLGVVEMLIPGGSFKK
ncbi:MAG: phage holin family protein [Tissierellia bacterium]|nr:phage holin family protein [Tissierellia bacterium]